MKVSRIWAWQKTNFVMSVLLLCKQLYSLRMKFLLIIGSSIQRSISEILTQNEYFKIEILLWSTK